MQVAVNLPESFNDDLANQIKKSAYEAFNEIKHQSQYPDYMKIDQASKFLNVSRTTLETKYIPAGLPVTDVDGLLRISKQEAIKFMNNHTY